MNTVSQIPRKPVTALIKDMLDGWRRIRRWSQSAVIDEVVRAHKSIDAERSTEIIFEEERPGRDLTHCQKINMQKVYRWLGSGESDDDSPGNMPANFLPSVLAALPLDLRIQLANDILAPSGLAVRALSVGEDGEFDPIDHLAVFLVEFPQAKQAVMKMSVCRSKDTAMQAIKELDDVVRVAVQARQKIEVQILRESIQESHHD